MEAGATIYLSGCIGVHDTSALVKGGVEVELEQAFGNALRGLSAAGLDLGDSELPPPPLGRLRRAWIK